MPRSQKLDTGPLLKTATRLQKLADTFLEDGNFKAAHQKYKDALETVEGVHDDEALDIRFACNMGVAQAGNSKSKLSKASRKKVNALSRDPLLDTAVAAESPKEMSGQEVTKPASRVATALSTKASPDANLYSIAPFSVRSRPASVLSGVGSPPDAVLMKEGSTQTESLGAKLKREKMDRGRIVTPMTPGPKTALQNRRISPTKTWGVAPQPYRECQDREDYITHLLRLEYERERRKKERLEQEKAALEKLIEQGPPIPGAAPPAPVVEKPKLRAVDVRAGVSPAALKFRLPSYRQRPRSSLPAVTLPSNAMVLDLSSPAAALAAG